ncbi:lytic transglycosylase domain-containing protein [Mucilaginibacter paludis]|uniref:Lytic transglycosylase catalytic n=1 Tax=Mucilaginibacter paludis DSM 18603 TaxID=714943 RepID=H1Y516_9SPHI|nr:lytic transglycosylase domain-containing protein [Mucilaginibacter paludis]EHQ28344.1 Lytic transglycosylase catalytic [Mucilaginibacter paludis DSM 18603]
MKKFSTCVIALLLLHSVKAESFHPLKKINTDSGAYTASVQFNKANPKVIDTTFVPDVADNIMASYQNMVYKRRLDSLQKDVPLDYNQYVQSYIDIYTAPHRKESISKILGLTKYYFPIYEKAFRDAGIPEEIKFLSVVESALDPNAVSRVGATGPWQFMFATAKLYGLTMDNYVDERRDPIQASYAAAAYIKDAYQDFGDWLVAIASYNCGKGAITRAIQKAGASDFWSIRPFLPVETRNYVPAYIAISYVMSYYGKHNIVAGQCDFSVKTDTILVNKYVALSDIAKVLNLDIREVSILNPQYKKQIINGTDAAPKRLVIPQIDKARFALLYDALNNPAVSPNQFEAVRASFNESSVRAVKRREREMPSFHTVKRGESLASIADKFGVEVQDLKVWNKLHKTKVQPGTELRVSAPSSSEDKYSSPKAKELKSVLTYKVKSGDTLSQIAEKFDGSVERIKALNGLKKGTLQPGMILKISKG